MRWLGCPSSERARLRARIMRPVCIMYTHVRYIGSLHIYTCMRMSVSRHRARQRRPCLHSWAAHNRVPHVLAARFITCMMIMKVCSLITFNHGLSPGGRLCR